MTGFHPEADPTAPSRPYHRDVWSSPRRHSAWGVPILDIALAAVLAFASVGAILTGEVVEGPRWVTLPVATISSLAVLLRTRAALGAVVAVCVAGTVQTLVTGQSPGTLMSLVVTLLLAYSVASEEEEIFAAAGLTILLVTGFFGEWNDHGTDYAFITVEIGGAWLLGRAARSVRSRATYAEQHRHDLARLAVAEERTRIARELHDVVAHGLSVIAVQADAADAALDRDPIRAREPLQAIRSSAREALGDMRQLLHVLREPETDPDANSDGQTEAGSRQPARGLADLPHLLATVRDAGLPVEAFIEAPPGLPPGTELATYRIVQEGLTNVLKHAGAVPTRLTVAGDGTTVHIEVCNRAGSTTVPASGSTSHGLVGARERALAAGGTLRAGPTADGGFELVAELPLTGAGP
jgi:signal transduction histidine kinase